MAVAIEQAAKDPRQGKLNLVARVATGPGTAPGIAAASAAVDREMGMQGT